jgi:hypothetical protein
MYVHSKSQLHQRLRQHNERDASLDYLRMEDDPRNGLPLIAVPKSVRLGLPLK